jgi:hypothetical protein
VPSIVSQSVMADTIARLRALWMKLVFITRSFSLTNLSTH